MATPILLSVKPDALRSRIAASASARRSNMPTTVRPVVSESVVTSLLSRCVMDSPPMGNRRAKLRARRGGVREHGHVFDDVPCSLEQGRPALRAAVAGRRLPAAALLALV